jgi:HAD superfamily hydrolase (TIGR01509 family)
MIKAVIFDMDDLMVNTFPVHLEVIEEVMQRHGATMFGKDSLSLQEQAWFCGRTVTAVFTFLKERYSLSDSPEKLGDEFFRLSIPHFASKIEAMPGLEETVKRLKKKYLLAVASSSKREKIDIVLKKFKLSIKTIISAEDVREGKPNPQVFLKALEKLQSFDPNLIAQECVVLEDATPGIEAARNAGMFSIGIHNQYLALHFGFHQNLSAASNQVDSLLKAVDLIEKGL